MKARLSLWGLLALSSLCSALPTPNNALERAETADSDDAFVYTWSLPEVEMKKRAETADSDDAFVYTWSVPEAETKKRAETVDSDDAFMYTWSIPEDEAKA